MKYHQGIKAEIETRSKNFSACLELGKSLLQRQHQASEEVRGAVGRRRAFSLSLPLLLGDQTSSWEGFFQGGSSSPTWSIGD